MVESLLEGLHEDEEDLQDHVGYVDSDKVEDVIAEDGVVVARTINTNIVDNEAFEDADVMERPDEADITVGDDIAVPGQKRKRGKQQYVSAKQHYAYRFNSV